MCTGPSTPNFASYGGPNYVPSQKRHKSSFWELHSRKCNSPRETKLSPNACLLRKAALSGFSPSPLLAIRTRRFWAASYSLCTGALQGIARAGNQLQTGSTSGRRRMGQKRPFEHWPHHPTFCQLGRNPARAHFRKGTKLPSGSCFRESETLLGKPSSAPMRVCSGKQRVLVSPLGLCLP